MSRIGKTVVVRAVAAALGSMVVTLAIANVMTLFFGGSVSGTGLILCIVCPLAIAGPCSAFQFWQEERLKAARAALVEANGNLERLHLELQEAHAALAAKSRIDGMTGALNRETFLATVKETAAAHDKGTLLFIDADHFKAINDRHGHPTGDAALRAIADAVRGSLKTRDVFGRIGGEEFAIFLPGTEERQAGKTAERVRLAVQALTLRSADGSEVSLTISIGGAFCDDHRAIGTAWRQADRLLYEAKSKGRNRVVISQRTAAA